jgi:hypothetical protein
MITEDTNSIAVNPSSNPLGTCNGVRNRVRSVEYEPGWGWIARGPDGREVQPEFRWRTRSAARDVAACARALVATTS